MQWCQSIRYGCIAAVEMLRSGLSDGDEIERAHILFSNRKGSSRGQPYRRCTAMRRRHAACCTREDQVPSYRIFVLKAMEWREDRDGSV